MKKKIICLISIVVIVVILLISTIAYFRPLSLSTAASENCKIDVILYEKGRVVGDPGIHTEHYQDLTDKQKSDILSVLGGYPYQRTFSTPFSDGSMSGFGNKMLQLMIFDGHSSTYLLSVTQLGEIVVNGKNYTMENAEQFIAQILAIVRPAE